MMGGNSLNGPTVLIWLLYGILASCTSCNSAIYGSPRYGDCRKAISKIPFAQEKPPNVRGQVPRNFVEPQYLQPPFRGVSNAYRRDAIVQLPKIWKHSMSNLSVTVTSVFVAQSAVVWKASRIFFCTFKRLKAA